MLNNYMGSSKFFMNIATNFGMSQLGGKGWWLLVMYTDTENFTSH